MPLTFQKFCLLWKTVCEDDKSLQNHFVSLALLLPYLLHIVFLLKAINLCWYLCQVGVLYKINVQQQNHDLKFHSYANFNFRCDLCFRAFRQAKNYFRKRKNLKRSFHIINPKGKSCVFKMQLNANLGTSIRLWTDVIFFVCFQSTWNFSWEHLLQSFIFCY